MRPAITFLNIQLSNSREQDEVDTQPKTNGLPEDGAEIAENVISDADVIVKETNE